MHLQCNKFRKFIARNKSYIMLQYNHSKYIFVSFQSLLKCNLKKAKGRMRHGQMRQIDGGIDNRYRDRRVSLLRMGLIMHQVANV